MKHKLNFGDVFVAFLIGLFLTTVAYGFAFSIYQTAIRCVVDSQRPLWDLPLWDGRFDRIPSEDRADLTLRGRRSKVKFPTIPGCAPPAGEEWGPIYRDVLALEAIEPTSGEVTDIYMIVWKDHHLYTGPLCGNTEIGGVELYKLCEARLVEFEGFAFDVRGVDDERYHVFYVWKAKVLEKAS